MDEKIDQIIRFVQDEIRYLSLSEGIYSLVPRLPAKILGKRYGDCKDKSILLATLLKKMGVSAAPCLVNSSAGKYVSKELPSPSSFDHAIVMIDHEGERYWVDPTITCQGGVLRTRQTFPYGKALVIQKEGEGLVDVEVKRNPHSCIKLEEDIYLEGDRYKVEIVTLAEGAESDVMRAQRNRGGKEQFEEGLRDYTARFYHNAETSQPMKWEDDLRENKIRIAEYYTADAVIEKSPIPEMGEHYPITPAALASRIVVLEKGDLPSTPVALMYPMNASQKICFHHSLSGVDWATTKEKISGPGFEYKFLAKTKKKEVEFVFDYSTTKNHLEPSELSDYTEKTREVFESMARGVPAKGGGIMNWSLVMGVLGVAIYFLIKAMVLA